MSRFLFAWVFLCVLLQYACASHSSGYVICHSQQNVQLNDPAWVKLMHVHIYISKWDISLNCLEFTDYKNVSLKGGERDPPIESRNLKLIPSVKILNKTNLVLGRKQWW